MQLTTWGMWDEPRKELARQLTTLFELTEDDIKTLLLETVITNMLGRINQCYREEQDSTVKSTQEFKLNAYKIGFDSGNILEVIFANSKIEASITENTKQQLTIYVNEMVHHMLAISELYNEYTGEVCKTSHSTRESIFTTLYGGNFQEEHPNLAKDLKIIDPDVIKMTETEVSTWMENNLPKELPHEPLIEHLKYIKEVANQAVVSGDVQQKFQKEVGVSMVEYKIGIENIRTYIGPVGNHLPGYDAAVSRFIAKREAGKQPAPEQAASVTCHK